MAITAQSRAALFAAATLISCAGSPLASQAATSYSVVGGFSIKSNPTRVWTYLVGSTIEPTKTQAFGGVKHWIAWTTGQPLPNAATVARNRTGAPISYLTIVDPTNALEMDPESLPDVAVRFTAPAAGVYHVKGQFLGIDTNEHTHSVAIAHGGTDAFTASISAYGQVATFKLKLELSAGDTVDFLCETGSTYTNLSTGLTATITTQ